MISTIIKYFLSAVFYQFRKLRVLFSGGNCLLVAGEYTLQGNEKFINQFIFVQLQTQGGNLLLSVAGQLLMLKMEILIWFKNSCFRCGHTQQEEMCDVQLGTDFTFQCIYRFHLSMYLPRYWEESEALV